MNNECSGEYDDPKRETVSEQRKSWFIQVLKYDWDSDVRDYRVVPMGVT